MTRQEKLALLDEWKRKCQALDVQHTTLIKTLHVEVGSPLLEAGYDVVNAYTRAMSALIGDTAEWLEWFAMENHYGRNGHEAGFEGRMRPIRTLGNLLDLIEEK